MIGSSDRQSAGAPPAERIVGYTSPVDGVFRLRAVLGSGPPPEGPLTLFSREIAVTDIGGTAVSSTPTPGDAAGAIAVGAVNWRGDRFKGYSSQGPSDDGRLKPDLVAPTDTRLMGPNGLRSVGRHLDRRAERRRRRRGAAGRRAARGDGSPRRARSAASSGRWRSTSAPRAPTRSSAPAACG